MNAPLHSEFGGSVAARVLRCPASVRLAAKIPAHLRRTTIYAERGAALHVAMALLIERERVPDQLAGETIGGYAITRHDVENALRPTLAHVDGLLNQPRAEYYLEQRVTLPGSDAFGTADLIVKIGGAVEIIDHKFGAGVRVVARDDDGLNAQTAFYAAAARHSLPEFFAGVERVVLTILQPQTIEADAELESTTEATPAELDDFVVRYRAACEDALGPSPHLERGAWCRFCPAKPICPLHTGPLIDLAQFALPPAPAGGPDRDAYLQALADGLSLIDATKELQTALHDQAKQALLEGWPVPGYALTKGRLNRDWRDEQAAIATLARLGLERGDLIDDQLRSPRQVELRAKARGFQVPPDLIVSRPSGVSLARAENARVPAPGRDELARSFTVALNALREGGKR